MTSRTDRQRLVALVEERLAELHALLVLTRQYHAEQRKLFEQRRAELPSYGFEELRRAHERVAEHVEQFAAALGATHPPRDYVEIVARMRAGEGQFAHMEKWRLKRLFRNYDACVWLAALLPEHTQMSMDARGVTPAGVFLEVRIVEASVFEDMCAQFNRAWRDTPLARQLDAPREFVKECTAARRAYDWHREAARLWGKYVAATGPARVAQLRVRYVNRLAIPSVPDDLATDMAGYLFRVALPSPEIPGAMLTITQGVLDQASAPPGITPMLLDIDLVCRTHLPSDAEEVWSLLNLLHAHVIDAFEASVTDTARGLFA